MEAKTEKRKLGDLILQTGRQTSVTPAKEEQLLCIPDGVETSTSGEECASPELLLTDETSGQRGRPEHLGRTNGGAF